MSPLHLPGGIRTPPESIVGASLRGRPQVGQPSSFVLTLVLATNYNNRLPTPIDGAWDIVERLLIASYRATVWQAFFERNRAYLCVFKRKGGSYEWHHFEINSDTRTLTIWELWLQKGAKTFDGTYELSGNQLRIGGRFANNPEESVLVLRKRE
jgi:hypothetical protein